MKNLSIIRHVDYVRIGCIPSILDELGIPFQTISLVLGDPLPEFEDLRGVISMGGPMSVYEVEEYPWLSDEMKFMRQIYELGIPFLGICLGGQLLAQAFGAKVEKGTRELGWLPLNKTEECQEDPIFRDLEIPLLFQYHHDHFDIPQGAVNLLSSDFIENQCFRLGDKAYGIQFHPEADAEMIEGACEQYKEVLSQADLDILCADHTEQAEKGRKFLKTFLERLFLENGGSRESG